MKIKSGDNSLEIFNEEKNSTFISIPHNSEGAEGFNATVCICDENWAWKNDKLFRALQRSTKARKNGLICCISTAGNNVETWWYSLVSKGRNILAGNDSDYRTLPLLFEANEYSESDLNDPKKFESAVLKTNPAIPVNFSLESVVEDWETVKSDRAEYLNFLQRQLNRWTADAQVWLPLDLILPAFQPQPEELLKESPLFLGMDLTTNGSDTSCVAECFKLPDDRFHFRCKSWACREGVRRRAKSNLPRLEQYANPEDEKDKCLELVYEESIPDEEVKAYILTKLEYELNWLITDQYHAHLLCKSLQAEGINYSRQGQGYADYTWSMKAFEQGLREKRITIEPNKLVLFQLQNCAVDVNDLACIRPNKKKSQPKCGTIDSVVAMLMAFGKAAGDVMAFENGGLFD